MQAAQEPEEETQKGKEESYEGSEDEEDMAEGDGDQEQHERMLAEVRAAGRPAGARRPREVQTESMPERALNVGPMNDTPGRAPSVQKMPAQARRPASLHSQALSHVTGHNSVVKPSFRHHVSGVDFGFQWPHCCELQCFQISGPTCEQCLEDQK